MSAVDEILAKQQKLAKGMIGLSKIKDPKELMEEAAKLVEAGKELEASCKRFADSQAGLSGKEERVVLTADQRERIAKETGVAMEMLTVRDTNGRFAHSMPMTDRATIERMAALQASEIAMKKNKAAGVESLIKSLEKLNEPSLEPIIEAIRADPSLATLVKQQKKAGEEAKAAAEGSNPG